MQSLATTSLQYVISLTIDTAQVTYSITENTKSAKIIAQGKLDNLQSFFDRYAGIGFIGVGCQASFKIIKPNALNYSASLPSAPLKR